MAWRWRDLSVGLYVPLLEYNQLAVGSIHRIERDSCARRVARQLGFARRAARTADELKPMQIMTDTGAYSDVVFGLFRLLDRRERFGRNPHGSSCSHAEGLFPPVCESARNRCCLLRGLLMRYQNRCAEPERYCVSSFKREPNRT